ncbi:MAG: hypothetical protein WA771_06295 [Chthoniobacterales bacterium]
MRTTGFVAAFIGVLLGCGVGLRAEDTLFMNDTGETKRSARVIGVDDQYFKIESQLGGGAVATVSVPRAEVSKIEFAPNEARDRMLENATLADMGKVALEWERWKGFVGVPKSPAGKILNVYTDLLLQTEEAVQAKRARAILEELSDTLWDEEQKLRARQNRLRAMVATGDAADAIEEAKELAKVSEDPAVLIEAKYILAVAAHETLLKLIENNPRWEEDFIVIPERARLVNESLDLYLYPYLFYGSEADTAARGLWGAIEIYEFVGDDENALESARDIAALYPDTSYAPRAAEIVARLQAPESESENPNESNDESETRQKS